MEEWGAGGVGGEWKLHSNRTMCLPGLFIAACNLRWRRARREVADRRRGGKLVLSPAVASTDESDGILSFFTAGLHTKYLAHFFCCV